MPRAQQQSQKSTNRAAAESSWHSVPNCELRALAALAAHIACAPFAGVLLLDEAGGLVDASCGDPLEHELSRDSFSAVMLEQTDLLEIDDLTRHARLAAHPAVAAQPGLRFFAGIPIGIEDGCRRAFLYVADRVPRQLEGAERSSLHALARQASLVLERERLKQQLEEALREKDHGLTRLQESEARFRTFMDNCPFLAFLKDEQGRFVFYNLRFRDHFAISAEEWIGKTDREIWPEDVAMQFDQHDDEVRKTGQCRETLEQTRDAAGRLTLWRSSKFPWTAATGERWLGAFVVDVTDENQRRKELEEANQQLARLATRDPLTGLGNRRLLDERVEFEFRFARRHSAPLAVILLDLDNFKLRNDLFGHQSGDEVLRRVGGLIARTLRATDTAARYGGEEFVILLPKADLMGAELFLERLLEAMRREPWPHAPVTASIGVSAIEPTTDSGKQLIAQADIAMYEAKRSGRDRIVTYAQVQKRLLDEIDK